MSGAIAVFVKTPGLSPVKTRLAVKLGTQSAENFHLLAANSVCSVVQDLSQQADIQAYYAVAEQAALTHTYWQDLPCLWQGEGGLGERMAHIYQSLLNKHDFVLIVGADIPQMTCTELLKAEHWLADTSSKRLAFAPSADGGFWLFGGNCAIAMPLWTEVTYSAADTGVQFLNNIKPLGELKHLAILRDVDEVSDLPLLQKSLLNLAQPTQAQLKLMQYLRSFLE
ncbi:MAG: DUF2064 domain-containing protein [Methyloprofundus sp.]|nr:DUF2064 domain-containing protein [Methyloprofundus sp.]